MHTITVMLSNSKFMKDGRRELQVLRDKSSSSQIKTIRPKQIERLVDQEISHSIQIDITIILYSFSKRNYCNEWNKTEGKMKSNSLQTAADRDVTCKSGMSAVPLGNTADTR